jgi:hypothetical protein
MTRAANSLLIRREWTAAARAVTVLVAAALVNAGCGTMFPRYFGMRPDAPEGTVSADIKNECAHRHAKPAAPPAPVESAATPDQVACEQYLAHVEWARQLAEAYRSRATMNEWAIYAGGTIALAGLSAVGGLGIAAASATTIGLIGVSTGFTSAFLAFMDNSTRAGFYTVAANDLTEALAKATQATGANPTAKDYDAATKALAQSTSKAINELESQRYRAAAAAAASQQVQKAQKDLQDLTKLIETAAFTELRPPKAKVGDPVTAVIIGIDLTAYKERIRIFVGGKLASPDVTSTTTTEVKFTVPGPVTTKSDTVRVWIGPAALPGEQTLSYE